MKLSTTSSAKIKIHTMSKTSPKTSSPVEMPQLNLALSGFSAQQVAQIETWLAQFNRKADASSIRWQISSSHCADVYLKALASDTNVVGQDALTRIFWPSPAAAAQESSAVTRTRFLQLLLDLNDPMQAAATRYLTGSLMVKRRSSGEALKGLWHVQAAHTLLAVVDFERANVAIRPDTHYLELEDAHWAARSEQAKAPAHFHHISIECLMWQYTHRSGADLLPARYKEREITLRRFPRLPLASINEAELTLLTVLLQKPKTFAQLSQQLSMPAAQTVHILGALYFSGAISTRSLSWKERLALRLSQVARLMSGIRPLPSADSNDRITAAPCLVLGKTPRCTDPL